MARRRRHFANTNFRWPREAAPLSWRTAVNTASSRDEAPTTPALPIRASVGFTPTPVSIRILPRGEPLAYPDEAATSSRSPSRAGPMQLQHRLHQRCQDRRGATARANVASTKPCFERHVYRRGHGLCRRPHHTLTPSSSCMENTKRRRRRRPHGLIGGISRSNPRE